MGINNFYSALRGVVPTGIPVRPISIEDNQITGHQIVFSLVGSNPTLRLNSTNRLPVFNSVDVAVFAPTQSGVQETVSQLATLNGSGSVPSGFLILLRDQSETSDEIGYSTLLNFSFIETQPQVADFSGSPLSGTSPLTVSLTNQSVGNVSNLWTATSGTLSSAAAVSPTVTYDSAGTFSISLSINNGVSTKSREAYIVVSAPNPLLSPVAAWSFDGTLVDAVNSYTFAAVSLTDEFRYSTDGVRSGTNSLFLANSDVTACGEISYNGALLTARPYTISMWVRDDYFNGESQMVFFSYESSDSTKIGISNNDDPATRYVSADRQINGESVAFAQWTHYVLTDDGTNVKNYRNGTLNQTESTLGSWSALDYLKIGSDVNGPYSAWFRVCDLLVYDFAVTASQVETLYNSGNGYFPLA